MDKIAFLFSGQGAQTPGMGQSLYACSDAARRVFDRAEALRPGTAGLCFEGSMDALSQTIHAQPCLFCVDLAAAEALRALGITPAALAGFSLGEIPALAFSGMLSFEEAFSLVCARGQAMQACAEAQPGSMLAVLGLPNPEVEALCDKMRGVYPANYNCPGQLVVACEPGLVGRLREAVREKGGKTLPLPVSGPFHTPLMADAEATVLACLQGMALCEPSMPVYANRWAAPYAPPYAQTIAGQITHPVRFEETLRCMAREGIHTYVEVGAGKTLCGFVRKTLPDAVAVCVSDAQSLHEAAAALGA